MSRSILVTGASSGIGRAVVRAAVARGDHVTAVSRRPPTQWEPPLEPASSVHWIAADLSKPERAAETIQIELDARGAWPEIIVSSAVDYGGPSRRGLVDGTASDWFDAMAVNAIAPALLLRRLLPQLLHHRRVLIAHLTSDVAFAPGAHRLAYASSKSAAQAFVSGLAEELAGTGVVATSILPERQVATPGLRRRRATGADLSTYQAPETIADGIVSLFENLGRGANGRVFVAGDNGQLTLLPAVRPPFDAAAVRLYDVRGSVPDQFGPAAAERFGAAFATILLDDIPEHDRQVRIVVGRDTRLTSSPIEDALVSGLASAGARVTRLGLVPTPLVAFAQALGDLDAGIMVTASHNPKDENGLKLSARGGPVFGRDLELIAASAASGPFVRRQGGAETSYTIVDRYIVALLDEFPNLTARRVVWDAGSGAACSVLKEIVPRLPGEHIVLNGDPDGNFPYRSPDPSRESELAQAATVVRESQADCAFAFDGDADRLRVLDENGRAIAPDCIGAWLAEDAVALYPNAPVIIDVKTSRGVREHLDALNAKTVICRVGHSYIKALMRQSGASMAIETSGHLYFGGRWLGIDDPFYAALSCLKRLGQAASTVSREISRIPTYARANEQRIPCDPERQAEILAALAVDPGKGQLTTLDGLRLDRADGWWLVRSSNSQAMLSISYEACDADSLAAIENDLSRRLARFGIVPKSEPEIL